MYAFVKKGCFQDSVSLMVLSRELSNREDIDQVSVMMGTPSNKDLLQETGLWHDEFKDATPNDICVAIKASARDHDVVEEIQTAVDEFLTSQTQSRKGQSFPKARSWRRATELLPDANLALISVAGEYADQPATQAIEAGMDVMIFSDNIPVETEVRLKKMADERGRLVMGPDCGTSIINGAPMAFANKVIEGNIGIVGASGTGIQELTSQISGMGRGITHAIGLGGRDLSSDVGGISAMRALKIIAGDERTHVIAFVSKPPAPEVRDRVLETMSSLGKPVVALFLGEAPSQNQIGNVYLASTLDQAARMAVELERIETLRNTCSPSEDGKITGYYTGGTLAAEAAMLLGNALGVPASSKHPEGMMFHHDSHTIIDLGDDVYTVGKPHPMIDPSVRNEFIEKLSSDDECRVLLVDVVLGYGSHENPGGEVAKAVERMQAARQTPMTVIATITGTDQDPQDREAQAATLQEAGIILTDSTREAVMLAVSLITPKPALSQESAELVSRAPAVINVGLSGFASDLNTNGTTVVQYQWSPVAGGNRRLSNLLAKMK